MSTEGKALLNILYHLLYDTIMNMMQIIVYANEVIQVHFHVQIKLKSNNLTFPEEL